MSTTCLQAKFGAATANLRELRFPGEGGEFVVEIVGEPPAWFLPAVDALGSLVSLSENWDSYGAPPIDPGCVAAALDLLMETMRSDSPAPSVVPTSSGGVQIEWHTKGIDLEVEFLTGTRISGLFEDHRTGAIWEADLTFDLQRLTEAITLLSRPA